MTEAVDYAASSVILMALIAFLLGIAPGPAHPEHVLGTSRALSAALDGFPNSAVALIAASLLGLTGMARALEEQRNQPDVSALTFEERLARPDASVDEKRLTAWEDPTSDEAPSIPQLRKLPPSSTAPSRSSTCAKSRRASRLCATCGDFPVQAREATRQPCNSKSAVRTSAVNWPWSLRQTLSKSFPPSR
jgi:hypothetical protein